MPEPDQREQLGLRPTWHQRAIDKPPTLGQGDVHLWCMPLQLNEAQAAVAMALLNDTQRDKYHRRATVELQNSYLAGRYYLMSLLAAYCGGSANELLLSYSRLNKPYLNPNPGNIQFNYTDTTFMGQSWGLLAITIGRAVGVDIECLSRQSKFTAIVKRRFGLSEIDYVTNEGGAINAQRFLACWTRKEAYGKATGQGINFQMRDMDLASPGKFELEFLTADRPSEEYRLTQIEIGQKLIAAVVVAGYQPFVIRAFNPLNQLP